MDFFLDNILYIALFITILLGLFLYWKNKYNVNDSNTHSNLADIELKLRAYERLAVFLERIEPVGMINRLELHSLNKNVVKANLIKNIIIEYEYNISQQIYVSDELWDLIDSVKNKIINNLSIASDSLPQKANTDDFVTQLLGNVKHNNIIIKHAQKTLKKEARSVS